MTINICCLLLHEKELFHQSLCPIRVRAFKKKGAVEISTAPIKKGPWAFGDPGPFMILRYWGSTITSGNTPSYGFEATIARKKHSCLKVH
jgi:hypothetical protein